VNKIVLGVHPSPKGHWVGDGFPVRSLFTYDGLGQQLSPFLLLDYAGPAEFGPAVRPRGVGEHPHRGFETVTIVYEGEVAHRDSVGNSGLIGPGDVQWMTAAAGILHEEFHSPAYTRRGGPFEMVQLWVNLPAKHKMSAPRYQTLLDADIPRIAIAEGEGSVRVIAGEFAGRQGPAATFSPVNVWDVRLKGGHAVTLPVPDGHNAASSNAASARCDRPRFSQSGPYAPAAAAFSPATKLAASGGRPAGSLAIPAATMGRSGTGTGSSGTGCDVCCHSSASAVVPVNGGCPIRHS